LFKTNRSMEKVEEILIEHNYKVLNLDYESRKAPIELIVEQKLEPEINAFYQDTSKQIHFVTHSLGGIIVREYLQRNPGIKTGRIVMLSPPNQGSELVNFFDIIPGVEKLLGPVYMQLSSDSASYVNNISELSQEIGIITGNRTLNFLHSIIIPGPDDGKVAVERAKLDEMSDFLVVEHSHVYIMDQKDVLDQITFFLDEGHFIKD